MNNRNKILTLLLVAQLIIIFIVYSGKTHDTGPAVSLMPGMAADQVRKMVIADNEHHSIILEQDGNGWYAASGSLGGENGKGKTFMSTAKVHYPVDQDKVTALVTKLVGLQSSRLVTTTRSSHDRLQVGDDNFNRRIELTNEAGITDTIYLGVAPNYKTIHVRRPGDDEVYLARDLALFEAPAEATSWWPANYAVFAPDALKEVEVSNEHGKIVLAKKSDGKWGLQGNDQPLADDSVKEFFDRIKEITLADIITEPVDERDLKDPIVTLTGTMPDKTVTLTIFAKDKDANAYVAKASDKQYYARIGNYEVEHLLNRQGADLLAAKK